jgi:hypothetical protein
MTQKFTKEFCAELTETAADQGCITTEERDALISFGSVPMCIPDLEDPSKRTLNSWCECGETEPTSKGR